MATRYAVASGNWSSTSTWDGGTLPASTDDVFANNKTVNIDQTVTAKTLKSISNASPVITAGGQFVVTAAATVTVTSGIAAADQGSGNALLKVNAGSAAVTINSAIVTGTNGDGMALWVVSGYTGTLTINGNLTAGSSTNMMVIFNQASCTINITGTLTAGGSTGCYGISNSAANAVISVTGNVVATTSHGINNTISSATITVTGDVTGGSAASTYGINNTGGALTVRGNLRPGSYSSGGVGAAAVNSTAVFRYSGHIYSGGMSVSTGPNGYFPILGNWTGISGEEIYLHVYDDGNFPSGNNGTQRILTRYGTNNPVAADVRSGTVYGASGLLTGTLAVPPAASVASGVPVDATTGTAALNLSDVLAGTGNQIAAVFP